MSIITSDLVIFDSDASSREEAINEMAEKMNQAGNLSDKEQYIKDVFEREKTATTAIGFSFATPHAKSAGVSNPCLGFTRFTNPFKWDEDSEPVSMMFQIAVPESGSDQHLEILATIFRNLIHEDFRSKLQGSNDASEICSIVENL